MSEDTEVKVPWSELDAQQKREMDNAKVPIAPKYDEKGHMLCPTCNNAGFQVFRTRGRDGSMTMGAACGKCGQPIVVVVFC